LLSSKTDNDSEQEDNEVRKLTAKIEQEKAQQKQRSPSTHSHQTTLKKSMILSSDQLKRLNLKLGKNKVEFSVTTALQGTTTVESNIFFFDHMTKFVISDIDGTITKYRFHIHSLLICKLFIIDQMYWVILFL
jgi:phosphatidate phosphatase PAH1